MAREVADRAGRSEVFTSLMRIIIIRIPDLGQINHATNGERVSVTVVN